jgi:hypothetical protein
VAGAGYAEHTRAGFIASYVVLIADPLGAQPPLSFSWNRDVVPHLPRAERVPASP